MFVCSRISEDSYGIHYIITSGDIRVKGNGGVLDRVGGVVLFSIGGVIEVVMITIIIGSIIFLYLVF